MPDFEAAAPQSSALGDVVWVVTKPRKLEAAEGDSLRLIVNGKPVAPSAAVGKRLSRFGLQGVKAGATRLRLAGLDLGASVLDLLALDGSGNSVDFARSHAALSRTLPVEQSDLEALSFVVAGAPDALPRSVSVASFRPDLAPLDTLGELALDPRPCPPGLGPGLVCRGTAPIKCAGDIVDRLPRVFRTLRLAARN